MYVLLEARFHQHPPIWSVLARETVVRPAHVDIIVRKDLIAASRVRDPTPRMIISCHQLCLHIHRVQGDDETSAMVVTSFLIRPGAFGVVENGYHGVSGILGSDSRVMLSRKSYIHPELEVRFDTS